MIIINLILLVTNIWIIIYTSLLDYLNFKLPAFVKAIYYKPDAVFPEPFEIRLYLALMVIFSCIIWIVSKYLQRIKISIHPLLNYGLFIILAIVFIRKIGAYPLAGDLYIYTKRSDPAFYKVFFIAYLSLLIFLIVQLSILSRLMRNKKLSSIFVYGSVMLISALATFRPYFPIAHLDESFFLGPVWEVMKGKTLYTDVPSQYGFLSILAFALLNKINAFNFFSLPVFIWLLYIVEYTLCFYLIFKTSKSISFSLIGLFSIFTLNFFSEYHAPQTGPFRWIPMIISLFLFYKLQKINSKFLIISISLLSLWFIDSGTALVCAYLLTLFWLFLTKTCNLKRIIYSAILLSFSIILILIAINVVHVIAGFKPIQYINIFSSVKKHAVSGLVMVPMESKTYFWLFVLVYFASIIYFFRNNNKTQRIYHAGNTLLLFSANLMLFAAIYYVGRSVPHNLFTISLFGILTLFLLFGIVYRQTQSVKKRIFTLGILFIFLIVFPAYQKKELITETVMENYQSLFQKNVFQTAVKKTLEKKYAKEIALIRDRLKQNEVIIISTDETYLLYHLDKKNILNVNPLVSIITPEEMDQALRNLPQKCPSQIVVDCTVFNQCPAYESFTKGWQPLLPIIFQEVQKRCRVNYKQLICTNKLCLVETK